MREADFYMENRSAYPQEEFYEHNSAYLSLQEELCICFAKSSRDAANAPTLDMAGDAPITIHVGGFEEHWQSRWLCYHFYKYCAMMCEGSESDRYWQILAGLLEGAPIPSDDIPLRSKSA